MHEHLHRSLIVAALVILAEIGDITRFGSAASWPPGPGSPRPCAARTAPSGTAIFSKQSSTRLRWILCEAAQIAKRSPQFAANHQPITRRRGKKIATAAGHTAADTQGLSPATPQPDRTRYRTGAGDDEPVNSRSPIHSDLLPAGRTREVG